MSYVYVNKANIDNEHICCAISETKNDNRVTTKKEWLKNHFDKGLKFIKLNERGKVFIEYLPVEQAWIPIEATNYYYINCFWVSGKYVKKGHGTNLLNLCLEDAKKEGKDGIVVLSSTTKKPFLSDLKFLKNKGFKVADCVGYFELLYLPLKDNAPIPKFKSSVKNLKIDDMKIVVYYSNQCPHTQMYVDIIEQVAHDRKIDFKKIKFNNYLEAQQGPTPFTTYSLFDNGQFITNEIFSKSKFEKYLEQRDTKI